MKKLVLLVILGLFMSIPAFKLRASDAKPSKLSPGQVLIQQGKYKEALAELNKDLARKPDDPSLLYAKVRALMGLRQYMPAARLSLQCAGKFPKKGQFRFKAGLCAFHLGYASQATKQWEMLYDDPRWNSTAYYCSARILLATGKEDAARELVRTALAKIKNPAPFLLYMGVDLFHKPPEALKAVNNLLSSEEKKDGDMEGYAKLLEAAGDKTLYQLAEVPTSPVSIKLTEKSGGSVNFSKHYEGIMDSNLGIRESTSVVLPAYFQGLKSKQWMMVDSGSTHVMITAALAKKLGLKEIAGAAYAGLGTEKVRRTAWVLIPSLKMGSLTIQNVPAIIISKKSDFWDRISGIIPLSLFNRFAVEYDRRHGNLTLYPSGTDPAKIMGQGTFTVPSLWFSNRPYVQADINGHAKRYCLLDTGSTDLYLALEHADELGLSMKTAKYNRQVVTGMAGSAAANVAEQVVIKMGTGEFQMPTVQVMKLDEDNNFIDCYGLFGRQLLDLFEIVFDYRKNVVAFRGYDKH